MNNQDGIRQAIDDLDNEESDKILNNQIGCRCNCHKTKGWVLNWNHCNDCGDNHL